MISKAAIKRRALIFQLMGFLVFINPAKLTFFQIKLLRFAVFMASFRRPKISEVSWFRVYLKKISLFVIRPKKISDKKIIIFFHGGGFFVGSFGIYRKYVALLAKLTAREICYVEYRLGPENKFPCQLEDAMDAYKYVLKKTECSKNIFLSGDSAGGNLALTLFLKIKKESLPEPAGIFVISPWVDPNLEVTEYLDHLCERDALLGPFIKKAKKKKLERLSKYFVNDTNSNKDPFISPTYGDFTGAPPLMVQYSEEEVFAPQIKLFINKLKKKDVSIFVKCWKNMWHDFQLETDLPETKESFLEFKYFLDKLS